MPGDFTGSSAVAAMFGARQQHFGSPATTVIDNALGDFSCNEDARATAEAISWEDFDAQFSGRVRRALNTPQCALAGMRATGFSRFVNIGTNLVLNPAPSYHDYTAAKAALLSLTRSMAADLGPENTSANTVSGGLLPTTDVSAGTPDAGFAYIASAIPLRKVTTPAELADALLLFVSPLCLPVGQGGHRPKPDGRRRLPGSPLAQLRDISSYERLAQIAERGLFDAVFFADGQSVGDLPVG